MDAPVGLGQAHFQSVSPCQFPLVASGAPLQTGLGLLMTVKSESAARQPLVQEDLGDHERQASSLAAAGVVAESFSLTWPVKGATVDNETPMQGIQAPPAVGMVSPQTDLLDWDLLDPENTNLDDLEMEFAMMFDPSNASIQGEEGECNQTLLPY
jgi:hypothetical protein